MSKLQPDMRANRIQDIDLARLWEKGIRGLVFDLDNTITPWHQYAPDKNVQNWFDEVKRQGFAACILSNSGQEKVAVINSWLDIPVLSDGRKPRLKGFMRASNYLGLPPEQLAMIGDQIFTDVWGGNKAGFYTILTEKIAEEEFWGTRNISRRLEKIVKRGWEENGR